MTTTTIIALCVIFVAAMVQRLSGMGFALVATPVLVMLFGPAQGVLVELVTGTFVSVVMLVIPFVTGQWRKLRPLPAPSEPETTATGAIILEPQHEPATAVIHWPRTLKILAAAVLVAPLGLLLVRLLPAPWLMILVACAAAFSLWSGVRRPALPKPEGRFDVYLTGATTGLLHVTSGLSGPPLVGYALKSKWDPRQFILSMQLIFLVLTIVTLAMRGLPAVPLPTMALLLGTALIATVLASILHRWVSPRFVRVFMLIVAWSGTAVVLVRGVLALLG